MGTPTRELTQQQADCEPGEASSIVAEQAQSSFEEQFQGLSPEERQTERDAYEEYIEAAFVSTANGEDTLAKLFEKQTELTTLIGRRQELENRRQQVQLADNLPRSPGQQTPLSVTPSLQVQALPPRLQLPRFSGSKRDWDAFWAIFKSNIDEQPISTMMKFNYLLQALTGEAKQVASRYQLIEDNYETVLQALKRKYGKDSSIVEELLSQLENLTAEGPSTSQQISMLDQLAALMTQLSNKGQDTNHRMILNTVLRKFEVNIQLKALEKREQLDSLTEWTWDVLYDHLSSILDLREKVEQSQKRLANDKKTSSPPPKKTALAKQPRLTCIYCKQNNHRSHECRTVPLWEREAFLARNQLCRNCGRPNHKETDCRSQACF
ncbi:unnamed protein product, partial [Heligmosomoides polygyrus]